MYKYIAVTNSTIDNCTALLRIDGEGAIEQYDKANKEWAAAQGMSGIYSGDIECEAVSKEQAGEIIEKWGKNAD